MNPKNPKNFGVVNYTGNKTKLLPALTKLFPKKYDRLLDVCAGGLSVSMSETKPVLANEYCPKLYGVYAKLKEVGREAAFAHIDEAIEAYGLDKVNSAGYLEFRDVYDYGQDPLDLITLMYHSFSNQLRFGPRGNFNMHFGARTFNPQLRKKLNIFFDLEKNIEISNKSFIDLTPRTTDFVYVDPPYLITDATYNVYWSPQLDLELMEWLDNISIPWAMSNVFSHKGKTNEPLIAWAQKYNISYIEGVKYVSGKHHAKNTDKPTVEVLIRNY